MTDENDGGITIDITKILTGEVSIRKMAKQFGLRRDDLINRIKETFKDDEEVINQINLIVTMNKIIFDDVTLDEASKELGLTKRELDQKIIDILQKNKDKLNRYYDKTRVLKENNYSKVSRANSNKEEG